MLITELLARRRVLRWAAAAGVAVLAAGVVVGGVLFSQDADLDELMDRRVVAALERADPASSHSSAGHAEHGEPVDPNRRTDLDGHELRCVARSFGHDPADAAAIEEVEVIYAHRMCAAVGPGLSWPASIRETGPVAVRLGAPDRLLLPERALPDDGDARFTERIRAVIPARYQDEALAFKDFVDPGIATELQDRITE